MGPGPGLERALGKVACVTPCGSQGPHTRPADRVWHLGHMLDLDPGHQVLRLSLKVLRSERFLWVIVFLFFSQNRPRVPAPVRGLGWKSDGSQVTDPCRFILCVMNGNMFTDTLNTRSTQPSARGNVSPPSSILGRLGAPS